jgi:hypothetical protein
MGVLMHALAASCEELRARTGNPPLDYHDNYFKYFMFGKYNGFVSKARVSACLYFLVY